MSDMGGERKCLWCGATTTNPKYCSRSCSAKASNKASPKRKPEGACERCGKVVITRVRFCEDCLESLRLEKAEERENIKSFRTLAGHMEKERVSSVSIHHETIFQIGLKGRRPIPDAYPIDDLIGVFLGILDECPKYVRACDVPYLSCLLRELRQFEVTVFDKNECVTDRAGTFPIRCFDSICWSWANNFFRLPQQSLLPVYAIGLLQFMEPHLVKCDRGHHAMPWSINPIVACEGDSLQLSFGTTFKKEYSEWINRMTVKAKVPPSGKVLRSSDNVVVLHPGDEFEFVVQRGHLTEYGFYDENHLNVEESDPPMFDVISPFQLRGTVISPIDMGELRHAYSIWDRGGYPATEIPIRWITSVFENDGQGVKLFPAPF